jgi:dTDP-D-glucose 4,6-dehydratase
LDKDKYFLKIVKSKENNGVYRGDNLAMLNIGTGYRINNIQMAEKMIELFGYGEIEFVEDRKGHDRRYALKSNIFEIKDTEKKLEDLILTYFRRTK